MDELLESDELTALLATDPYGNKFTATTAGIITEPFYNYAHYYKK